MKVADCMCADVEVVAPDQSIREAARMMLNADAGSMPVGENDRLVGMITDRDIAVRAVARGLGPDTTVRDVMSQEVLYCFDDEETEEVATQMGDLQVRRFPVVNRDKRLVGIISMGDLAKGDRDAADDALVAIVQPGGQHNQS